MPLTITKVRIFVASPGDVTKERDHLSGVVAELNTTVAAYKQMALELIRWETHAIPGMGRVQELINAQAGSYDIFVGIMWRRFGTPTGTEGSGTEEEFRLAYEAWRKEDSVRILFYFSQSAFMPRSGDEIQQFAKVLAFRQELEQKGLVWEYKNDEDFPNVVRPHLTRILLDMRPAEREHEAKPSRRPSVFIGGSRASLEVAHRLSVLLDRMGVDAVLWSKQFETGKTVLESLSESASCVNAAIFILTGDDSTDTLMNAPKANVVLELGVFLGSLGRQRTFILTSGAVRLPSDILGTIYLRFDPDRLDSVAEQLRREFRTMGLLSGDQTTAMG
jgi:predicted nucleotide-binding protein